MFELRFDAINSDDNWEYYDIYLDNIPIYKERIVTSEEIILSLSVDKRAKSIEMINVSEHTFFQIRHIKNELYQLIVSLIDELGIRNHSIYIMEPPDNHNDIMTNELAHEIKKVYPDYNIEIII